LEPELHALNRPDAAVIEELATTGQKLCPVNKIPHKLMKEENELR